MILSAEEVTELESYSAESLGSFSPFVRVEENGDYITVKGFRSRNFELALKKSFKTARVYNGVFFDDGYRYLRFHRFYAIEMVYVCKKILDDRSNNYVSRDNLMSVITGMYKNTWLKNTVDDTKAININTGIIKKEFTVEPFDYQWAFLKDYAVNTPKYDLIGSLLDAAPGSGKTLTGLFFSKLYEAETTIILCPKPVVEQIWVDSIEKFLKRPHMVWDSVSKGRLTGKEDYIVCHFQAIDEVLESTKRFRGRDITLWIDESHKATEESSQLVQKIYQLHEELSPQHTVHASGTPLKARPTEAIPLLKTVDPLFKGEAVESYTKVFGSSKPVALDILNNRLGIVKFKVTKEQYSKIEETDEELKVSMPNSKEYTLDNVSKVMKEKAEDYVSEYLEDKPFIITEFKRLHDQVLGIVGRDNQELARYFRMASKMHDSYSPYDDRELVRECKELEAKYHLAVLTGEDKKQFKKLAPMYKYPILSIRGKLLGNVLGKMRIKCFTEMARNMELEKIIDSAIKKTIIFTSYVDPLKAAEQYCKEKGYDPITVSQETNKDVRSLLKRAEKEENTANPIIATYQSLGTGNEVVMCSTYVAIDVPYREYVRNQARARINRASQDSPVTYYEAVLDTGQEPNLSTRNLDILKWSGEMVDAMLGTEGDNIDVDYDEDISLNVRSGLGLIDRIAKSFSN